MSRLKELIHEIHRRSLWQVLGIYVFGGWVVLTAVDTLAGALNLPDWAPRLALFLMIIGLPIVLATAFVQEGVAGRSRKRIATEEAAAAAAGAAGPGGDEPAVRYRLFTWRNALLGGVGAFALWGLISATSFVVRSARDEPAGSQAVSSNAIAVLPFAVQGSDEFAYLGDGIVSLLSTKLDGAGELRSVDPRALLGQVERQASASLDVAFGRAVAARFGAGRFVMGDIVEVGGRLQISASLYDPDQPADPLVTASAAGTAEEIFELVDELAADLLRSLVSGPGARVARIAAVTTPSVPAFKAYLEGEADFRGARFGAAVESFRRAVGFDSLYALAYYRLSVAAEWDTRTELAQQAAEEAVRHSARLSERDRRLLEALLAWRRGSYTEAESGYRSFVGAYPDDVEAWFQLGEVLFHANPIRGRPFVESRAAFERVVEYEPGHTPALLHLARIAAREGRHEELESLVEQVLTLNPGGDREAELRTLRAFARGTVEEEDQLIAWLEGVHDLSLVEAAWDAAAYSADLSGLHRTAGLLSTSSRAREVRAVGHIWRALALLGQGKWGQAQDELAALEPLDRGQALEYRVLFALLPYAPVEATDLRRLRDQLERLDLEGLPVSRNPSFFFAAHEDIQPMIKEYLLGLLRARLGESDDAYAHAERLARLDTPGEVGSTAQDLAHGIRAEILRAQGRPEEALAELGQVRAEIFYHRTMVSPYVGLVNERFLRAELLRALERNQDALIWYESLVQINPSELIYLPAEQLRRAQIYDELGQLERAREHYARVLELWADADEELLSYLDEAEARLSDLMAEGG